MALSNLQIAATLDTIANHIERSDKEYDDYVRTANEWAFGNAGWYLELAYTGLLVLAEALDLPVLRTEIAKDLADARKEGIFAVAETPHGEPSLKWANPARRYLRALKFSFGVETNQTVTKDLDSIIREATYVITDRRIFGSPPGDERAVHLRLEGILRCVFPDLLHKPKLSKPIKNFEPDTGIPSIQTLVEYKCVSRREQIGGIADELLADTRGYEGREWRSFVFVIYEVRRFQPESSWRQLLRTSGVDERTRVVVLTGEPIERARTVRRAKA